MQDTSSPQVFSRQDYEALREGAGVLQLAGRGRLVLTGADRRSYLQGLLTNDIEALGPGTGCYAAFLTAHGRMISDMRVLELGDLILLDVPRQTAPTVGDRLSQFVFSEDVEVADFTDRWTAIGIYGPASPSVVAAAVNRAREAGEPAPTAQLLQAMPPFGTTKWDAGGSAAVIARNDDYGVPGFDLYVDAAAVPNLLSCLTQEGGVAVGTEALDVLRIEAGVPAFGIDMDEETIPLEADIQDRAISLTKGCYVGQEIIIRVLHRGHGRVARRLVGLAAPAGAAAPGRGDRILTDGRDIGAVTSAAVSPALGRPVALGYVHRDFTEAGTQVAIAHAGASIDAVVVTLPVTPPASG